MKKILVILILTMPFSLITYVSMGNEGSFSICNIQSYSISYDDNIEKIMLPCSGDAQSLCLNIINPDSLQVEKEFYFNGLIKEFSSYNNGMSLFVCLGELDDNSSTEEGMLAEVNYSTGNIIRFINLSISPMEMIIDTTETFAYVQAGIDSCYSEPSPRIYKVSLSTFQIVDEVNFGGGTMDIEITPDGSKIYLDSEDMYPEQPCAGIQGIGVFRTSDMEMIKRFPIPTPIALMEMSDNGEKLFIGSHNYDGTDFGADLYIVSTQTDEIIQKLRFYYNGMETGTYSLAYCAQNNILYCSAQPKTDYAFRYSNLIIELDLTDYSYSFFTMGDNPLIRIALAEYDGCKRLFAIEEEDTPVVHWKDLN